MLMDCENAAASGGCGLDPAIFAKIRCIRPTMRKLARGLVADPHPG
jgi:hypothetical protein